MMTREELIDEIKRLEQRRTHILEHGAQSAEANFELRRIKSQIRAVGLDLSKLKTVDWQDNPWAFCRIFKFVARKELDVETYELLVKKTADLLKRRNNRSPYNRRSWEGDR
jgi:hypothetical protein